MGSPSSGIGARVYYAAEHYDNVDRLVADVDGGTNGGTAWTRPSSVPSSSATLLVTTYAYYYWAFGPYVEVHDPMGIATLYTYDNLGRQTRIIQNYTGQAEQTESDVSTSYYYDGNNNVTYVQANEPGGAYQETRYVYGVTTAGGSGVNSNDILSAIQYPDPSTGHPSSQQDKYLTDALGDVVQSTDRNGTVHQYSYDVLGRLTSDNVTSFGVGVDATIHQITYGYDSQGNVSLITSLKAGGTIANQVERFFNGLGQLTTEYQAHNGEVNLPNTPGVQYAYNEMSNGQNNSRLVRMTYPDGYQVFYNYNAGVDSNISRLSSLSDNTGTLESYLYLGLNTVVERDHPQTGINLTYIQQAGDTQYNSDGGDQYTGLDRFGRIIDQFWTNTSTGTTVDRYQYGYNQDSEVLYRQNLVDTAMSELYSYDNLGQLTSFQRGTLNASRNGMVGSPSHSQSWTPDALGNFNTVTTDGTGQSRTANQQNEYTSITGQNAPAYDAGGNLTADGAGNTYVYDAWNRLVAIKNSSTGATVASYHYDGLNRLVSVMDGATLTDLYYSSSGQVVAEYSNNAWSAHNVWSAVYVNALVYRETGNQDYYALQDANWNVTAWVLGGTVMEREVYDAYGAATPLSSSWGVQGSPLKMTFGFQGMYVDWTVGLNFTRGRVYDPMLMRWLQSDPLGQVTGDNGYEMEGNDPTNLVDPSGLWPYKWPWEKDASWSFQGSLIYDVIDKTLEPVRMGGDLMRAGQAGANNAVGGTPYVPEWRSKLARNAPPPADKEANLQYLIDAELENLEDGAIAAGTMGVMKGGGKVLRKVVGRGTAAEAAAAKGAKCPAPKTGVRGYLKNLRSYWERSTGGLTQEEAAALAKREGFGFEVGRQSRFENARDSVVIGRGNLQEGLVNRMELAEEIQHGLDRATHEASRAMRRGLSNEEFHAELFERIIAQHKAGGHQFLTPEDITAFQQAIKELRGR